MGEPAATVGVLALQGDVLEHEAALADVGLATRRVRRPADLDGVGGAGGIDGLVLPGGESTTLSMLLESSGLFEPVANRIAAGLPTFGTCAGLILLASRVEDGRDDQRTFGALDCEVRRNGYGPQRYSFEGMVEPVADVLEPGAGPLPAVFIRAPLVTDVWGEVQVLATVTADSAVAADSTVVADGRGGHRTPVVLRQRHVLCATFHPELTGDRRLQRLFAAMVRGEHRRADAPARATPGRPTRRREGEPMVVRR